MPTYEYKCSSCGYKFEEFQSISDAPLVVCPSCLKPQLKRLLSGGAGLVFKGSGFYLTDYKNSHSSTTEPSTSSDSPKITQPGEKKADDSAASTPSVEKNAP